MKATGRLEGATVIVDDTAQANRLHNKGLGTPLSGNALMLTLVEAAYAVEGERLRVMDGSQELDLPAILALTAGRSSEVALLAYRDLRERGLLVRHQDDAFLVWRRGETVKQEPWFTMWPASEREPLSAGALVDQDGVVSVVDEDGTVTQYRLSTADPQGHVQEPDAEVEGTVLQDRVVVQAGGGARALHGRGHYGTPHGSTLLLSFTEAEHLRARGALRTDRDLLDHASRQQHQFTRTLPVYRDLRKRGLVARSGFRFGTHLRAYEGDPGVGHAPYLVQAAFAKDVMNWSEVSRAVRLAHGVRKTFCIAVAPSPTDAPGPVQYVSLAWFRP